MANASRQFRVLLVCSGNTCRSPMAAAALRNLLGDRLRDAVVVESAGAYAVEGTPATTEAVQALRRVGIDAGKHRSRKLTAEMVRAADLILVMEPHHRSAVLDLVPEKREQVELLHAFRKQRPRPEDMVHDPIGGSPEIYEECLGRIRRHLERVRIHLEDHAAGREPAP